MDLSKYLNSVDNYSDKSRPEFEDMLRDIVQVPTVSMDPERKPDIRRGADLAARFLKDFGAAI